VKTPRVFVHETSPEHETSCGLGLMAPSVGGLAARRITEDMKLRLLGRPDRTMRVGRYDVRRRLGAGSQGVVYEATDGKLERRVALKLLSFAALSCRDRATVEARLRREAMTLAQIRHPNVVEVFDVGIEQFGDDAVPYLVMELIDGADAEAWSAQATTWRDVVEVFLGAGEGLLAAHRRGIAHRDFKPANVLVGRDGVPRVADFGLARGVLDTAVDLGSPIAPWDLSITCTGAVLGTPSFMAPEQHGGGPADPKADQFAFCASLYRCLYRAHAFPGSDAQEILERKTSGPALPPPRRAPRRVWEVLRRGLHVDPRDRHRDMQALLAELRAACRPRSRTAWPLVSALAAVVPLASTLHHEPRECAGSWLRDVWTPAHADAVHRAFDRVELAREQETRARLLETLDGYRAEHLATLASVCRGDEAPPRAAAMECLGSRRSAFDVLHEQLASGDRAVVEHSLALSEMLPASRDCLDPRIVATYGVARAVSDADIMRLSLQGLLHFETGRLAEAKAAGMEVVERASAGDGQDVATANGLLLVAAVDLASEDPAAAASSLTRAFALAHARVDDVVAARAAAQMVAVSIAMGDDDGVQTWSRHSEAARLRAGGDAVAERMLASSLGERAFWAGLYDEAARHQRRAVDLIEETGGRHNGRLAAARNNLAVTYEALGRWEEALAVHEQNRRGHLDAHGPDHPALVFPESNLGVVAWKLGRAEEALAHLRRAARIAEAHGLPEAAGAWISLASVQIAEGDLDEAAASIRAARSAAEGDGRPPTLQVAIPLTEAQLARAEGRLADADAAWVRARAASEPMHLPVEHPVAVAIAIERALIESARGDIDEGVRGIEDALAQIGGDAAQRGETLVELGRILLAAGRHGAAVAPLVEAVELLSATGIESCHARTAATLLADAQHSSCCDVQGCRACG
jgi:tetratricopeptide (TPR) repeat protein